MGRYLPGAAMGAGAIGQRFSQTTLGSLDIWKTGYASSLADEIEEASILEAVVDKAPVAARDNQSLTAQSHQVLGNISLPPSRCSFQVADAGFSRPKRQQYF